MEFATWVLVIITAMYVVLTGGLVLIGWLQLRRESNPVVYPRVQSASVAVDGEQPCLNMKLTLAVLGRTPATNVVLRGTLQVLSTSATDARSAEFRSGALPVLGVGESDPHEFRVKVPELGLAGRDQVTLPVLLSMATEYRDVAEQEYFGLVVFSPNSLHTPLDAQHSWGVSLRTGVFLSRARPRNPISRWRMERIKTRAKRKSQKVD